MNFIRVLFSLLTVVIIIYSSIINFFESRLPQFLSQIFRYGKFGSEKQSKLAIEVPKSWFKHFYILAFFLYTYLLWLVTAVYIFNRNVPEHVTYFLDLSCGSERVAFVEKRNVFIAVVLLTIQVYRRFYDTQRVSVFSEKSRMNLSHYLVGLIHYPGAALAILSEAPLFTKTPETIQNQSLNLHLLSVSEKIAILLFMLAWKHQYTCTKILANLRKNEDGQVVSSKYKLPHGDWFELLSCPHQTAEILMYSCLMWILWNNITWFFVFSWVLSNQVETILMSHWWYQKTFSYFPKNRKALIPFVY